MVALLGLSRLFPLVVVIACAGTGGDASARTTGDEFQPASMTPREQAYKVVATYPHDPEAWTQGLIYHNGSLFEGTGQTERSTLREVEITTGVVKRQVKMADDIFGEGIALVGNQIYQLTWQNNKGFIYELDTFKKSGEWPYQHEGWGLTYDGTSLVLSDGTSTLRFINPRTMAVTKTLQVKDNGRPVESINELEMVKGELFANIWLQDSIARIDLATGNVNGWLDMRGLLPQSERNRYENVDVLNGIAYDPAGDRLFITGKRWPKLYEIKLVPVQQQ